MNTYTEQRLQEIKQQGYELRFDEIFSLGFSIWKKVTLPIAGILLLLIIVVGITYGLASSWINGMSFQEMLEMLQKNPEAFQKQSEGMDVQLRSMVFIVSATILLAPIGPGFLRMCYEADIRGGTNISTAFDYYKPKYWGRILVVGLFSFILTSGAGLLFGMMGGIGSVFNLLFSVTVHIFVFFAVPLIIFAEADPIRALGTGFKLGAKGFFPILGFSIIAGFLAFLGFFACCVGFLFSMSYVYVINYLAYRQAIGFEELNPPAEEEATSFTEMI